MLLTKRHRQEPIPRHAAPTAPHLTGRRNDEISFRDIAALPEPAWVRNEARAHFWPGRFTPAALVPSGRLVAILLPDPAAEEMADLTAAIGAMLMERPESITRPEVRMTLAPLMAELADLAPVADAQVWKAGAL